MTFKIKDGVRIGTVDIFNNSGESLNVKIKDTNSGAGYVGLNTAALSSSNYTQTLQAKSGTIALTSDIGNGTLSLGIGTAAATNTTVTIGTGTGFSANTSSNTTYDIKVGPALTNLASTMTGATTGFLKKTDADTYTLDTNTYLTAATQAVSKNIVGATASATENAAATNSNVYLNHLENTTITSTHKITGAGATTVTSDSNGNITVTSTDTTYSKATSTVLGLVKLEDDTVQTVAANSVTATAGRTYGLQFNSNDQLVVNVPWTDTTYSLATSTVLGLVKLGSDTQQTVDANAVSFTASRTYAVQVNSDGQMLVNVPWSNTDTLQTSADDTTNADRFIDFVNNASGAQTAGTSANFKFNPSTSTLLVGGATGSSPAITTASTGTASVFNTNATTVNAFGAATAIAIGAATGTTNFKHNVDIDLDLNVDGGDITTTAATFNLINAAATTVNFAGAATALSIGAATGTTTVNNNLTVSGNLVVNGTTTTVNSNTLTVDDKNIEIGSVVQITGLTATLATGTAAVTVTSTAGMIPGQTLTKTAGAGAFGASTTIASVDSPTQFTASVNHATAGEITFTVGGATDVTANGGGITLKGATDKTFSWLDATDAWTSSEHINLATGKAYYINGISVLDSTTLGSGVVNSSLTKVGLTSAGWVKTDASGNLSSSASLAAGDLSGTIPSTVLGNSTLYVGTTAIALNRASAAQSLTGITSIDGSAATLTTSRTLWGQSFNGSANVSGNLTSVGNITATGAITVSSSTTNAITIDSGTTGAVNLGTGANAKAISIGNSTVASTIALNNNTTLSAGKTLTLSGSTSGTVTLSVPATAGTSAIAFPAASGTVALTSDIKDGTLTRTTPSSGLTNTAVDLEFSTTYSANTATNTTVKAVVGPALTNLASTMTGAGTSGFLKKTGADTYTLDTNTYLTSESTDFKTVTITDTDSGYTWTDNGSATAETVGDTLTLVSGEGVELDVDAANDAIRVRGQGSEHAFSQGLSVTIASPVAGAANTLDTWAKATYRAAKYVISIAQGSFYQSSEVMVFNDGTTTGQFTEYAVFSTSAGSEVTFSIDASGANMILKAATPTATTPITFKIHRTITLI